MSAIIDFFRNHKIFSLLLVLTLVALLWFRGRLAGPYPGYELDFVVPAEIDAPANGLEVGVAMQDISPDFSRYDTWVDVNDNSKYDKDVDTYTDQNGNGKFDAIWMAGFNSNRPAKGLNDTPWVRAIALRNNGVLLVLVSIDSVGIFHNDFVTIR